MSDYLGDEGRKAVNACVKVAIFGEPEVRRYSRKRALDRLWKCYGGNLPNEKFGKDLDAFILPERDHDGEEKEYYSITDINDARDNFDKMAFVQIYREDGERSDEIYKRRSDMADECQKVRAGETAATSYSVHVAQRRVRDCYAGNFPGDVNTLDSRTDDYEDPEKDKLYSIFDIYDALIRSTRGNYEEEVVGGEEEENENYTSALKRTIVEQRQYAKEERKEAMESLGNKTLFKYSLKKAQRRVKECYKGIKKFKPKFSRVVRNKRPLYTIFDIRDLCIYYDALYSKEIVPDKRKAVEDEYQKAVCASKKQKYSRNEAERRVRDCLLESLPKDADILPIKGHLPKDTYRYDISEIKEAVDYYDEKKLVDKYPAELQMVSNDEQQQQKEKKRIQRIKEEVDECRAAITQEYKEATTNEVEIDHGSGFLIQKHFIITSAHVVADSGNKVYIYNQDIDPKLLCEVIYCKELPCVDLALLYCECLDIGNIQPLQLTSDQNLLPGTPIFTFGYPIFHTGRRALLATGCVSGTDEPFGQAGISPLVILNCSLNNGNSGGPLLHLVNNEVKVAGVVAKKHKKDILEPSERIVIDNIRKSLQTSDITDLKNTISAEYVRAKGQRPDPCQTPLNLLTLKLYDALETHSQFVSGKAVPQDTLRKFLEDAAANYKGKNKEELDQLILASVPPLLVARNSLDLSIFGILFQIAL